MRTEFEEAFDRELMNRAQIALIAFLLGLVIGCGGFLLADAWIRGEL